MALDVQAKHVKMMTAATAAPSMRKLPEENWVEWQKKARAKLGDLLGLPMETVEDPNFRIDWTKEEETYTETRFYFESEPECTVVCHLLIPKNVPQEKIPLIICLQGHSNGFHISLGQPKYEGDAETISGGDRDFARQIIARGQAALAIEQRAFGERGGNPEPQCYQPSVQAFLLGRTIVGERCWDVSRAIDVVGEQFPVLDMNRIAIMGNSGGGITSIYAAAMDTRIAAVMPSCALCGLQASFGSMYHCLCSYIPGMLKYFDMGDVAALVAPRPYVVVNGEKDPIFPIGAARNQYAVAKAVYEDAGAGDKIRHVVGPAEHRFYADISWPVFDELTGWRE